MALRFTSPQGLSAKQASSRHLSALPCSVRTPVVACRAGHKEDVSAPAPSRREALGGLAALIPLATLMTPQPASAFLGFGDDNAKVQETYMTDTRDVLDGVQKVLDLDKTDPGKEDAVKELRKKINSWVAAYRREDKVSGRPSFGVTYSILNALAGHFNSFGPTAPIPKKRLERINKEMKDADLYLKRNR